MDPFTLAAIIGGGSGILSSIFGGMSESQNAALARAMQEQERADAKLGQTDARGNRTRFVEGKGWVTEFGPTDAALEAYFLNQELPARQDQFRRADQSSRREFDQSNALLDEFQRIQREDPAAIEDLLFSSASRGIGENTQNSLETAMRSIMRSGSTSGGKVTGRIQEAANKGLADAAIDSKLKSLDYVDNKFNTERGNTSSLYNLFANRARADLMPTTSANTPSTTSSVGSNSGLYQAVEDNGLANALGGIGSALSGSLNTLGSQQQNASTNALLQSFISGGGQMPFSSGGIFGSIADRSKARGSVF